eukprot:13990067-Ditylum_brightwellii.AAC.1
MEAGRRLSSNKNSKSSTAKLSKLQRDMILNMSSKDGISPEEDLVDSLKDFMDQSTVAMAYEHLQERLRGRKVANRNPVFGNIASRQKAHFISREDGIPGKLTIFAFPQS